MTIDNRNSVNFQFFWLPLQIFITQTRQRHHGVSDWSLRLMFEFIAFPITDVLSFNIVYSKFYSGLAS